MRVSVVMCTYNGGKFVAEQLESFARQARPPDEVVVCDDRSSDATPEMVRQFAAHAPFPVRLHVNPTNLGLHRNFAHAIGLADGDIIFISDQDDVWLPEKIATMSAEFEKEGDRPGLVICDATLVDIALRPVGGTHWQQTGFSPAIQNQMAGEDAFAALLRFNLIAGATMALRADLRDVLLPMDKDAIYDAWIPLVLGAFAPIALVRKPLNLYRQHANQAVGMEQVKFSARMVTAKAQLGETFREAARQNSLIRDRMEQFHQRLRSAESLKQIEEKIAFAQFRARLFERHRALRWPSVLLQAALGRYGRYASGWKSVLKDCLF